MRLLFCVTENFKVKFSIWRAWNILLSTSRDSSRMRDQRYFFLNAYSSIQDTKDDALIFYKT